MGGLSRKQQGGNGITVIRQRVLGGLCSAGWAMGCADSALFLSLTLHSIAARKVTTACQAQKCFNARQTHQFKA